MTPRPAGEAAGCRPAIRRAVMPRETIEAPPHQVWWNRPPRRTCLPALGTSRAPALLGWPTISFRLPTGLQPRQILQAKNNSSWPRTGGHWLGGQRRSARPSGPRGGAATEPPSSTSLIDCRARGEEPPEELAEEGDASLHRWAFERPAVAISRTRLGARQGTRREGRGAGQAGGCCGSVGGHWVWSRLRRGAGNAKRQGRERGRRNASHPYVLFFLKWMCIRNVLGFCCFQFE